MTIRTQTCHLPAQNAGIKGFLTRLVQANTEWRTRQALRNLDDRLLDDIGVTRDEAVKEADKPIWDAPKHWSR